MSPYWVALLFLWDVIVDVFISPVKHQLLFLSVVDPHDGSGDLLDDVLQVPQLTGPCMGHFLHVGKKIRIYKCINFANNQCRIQMKLVERIQMVATLKLKYWVLIVNSLYIIFSFVLLHSFDDSTIMSRCVKSFDRHGQMLTNRRHESWQCIISWSELWSKCRNISKMIKRNERCFISWPVNCPILGPERGVQPFLCSASEAESQYMFIILTMKYVIKQHLNQFCEFI